MIISRQFGSLFGRALIIGAIILLIDAFDFNLPGVGTVWGACIRERACHQPGVRLGLSFITFIALEIILGRIEFVDECAKAAWPF